MIRQIDCLRRDESGLCARVHLTVDIQGPAAVLDTYGHPYHVEPWPSDIQGWGTLDGPAVFLGYSADSVAGFLVPVKALQS